VTIRKPSAVVVVRWCPTGYSEGTEPEPVHHHLTAMTVIRSTITGSPTTGAQMRLFVLHHPEAKRLQFSVSSRWTTFKSFTTLDHAIAWFEAKALEWA
jgi:hypothetical protein